MMQNQGARRNTHHIQYAVESLAQHLLYFAAGKARSRQIQIRKRQHIAFDSAALLFVDGHQHQNAAKHFWQQGKRQQVHVFQRANARLKNHQQTQNSRPDKGEGQQLVGSRFFRAALVPEGSRYDEESESHAQAQMHRNPAKHVDDRPGRRNGSGNNYARKRDFQSRVQTRRTIKSQQGQREDPFVDGIPGDGIEGIAQRRADEIAGDQEPGHGPGHQIFLALLLVDVAKKAGQKHGSGQQYDCDGLNFA